MWVALFLVCLPGMGCEEVVEVKRTYHSTQEICEQNAVRKSGDLISQFRKLGYNVEVGYRCDLDKTIRESKHG